MPPLAAGHKALGTKRFHHRMIEGIVALATKTPEARTNVTKHPHLIPFPATREPISLLAVDRALSDLRRGRPVAVRGSNGTASLVEAAEAVTPQSLSTLAKMSRAEPLLAITARRAAVLGLTPGGLKVVTVTAEGGLTAEMVRDLSNPLSGLAVPPPFTLAVNEVPAFGCDSAAVLLAKTARLLPAVFFIPSLINSMP